MPIITFEFPDAREEDLLRRFTVNRHYLTSFSNFLQADFGSGDDLFAALRDRTWDHRPFLNVRGGAGDDDAVRRWMRLAWTSEIQLHLPGIMGTGSVLGFSNAWAPVHAYYAVYGGLQAWFAANGMTGVADDHSATLRSMAGMLVQRNLLPSPWNTLCVGCPMRGDREYVNAPSGVGIADNIEVLTVPVPFDEGADFWPRFGTWLRTTRRARLEAREDEWRRRNGKTRISAAARTQIADRLAPTSVFDCFWRMRIRANYGSVDQFLAVHVDDRDHALYFSAICEVTTATVALLELFVARRLGRQKFAALVADFLAGDENGIADRTLRLRATASDWIGS